MDSLHDDSWSEEKNTDFYSYLACFVNRTTNGFEAGVDSGPTPSAITTVFSLRMMTPPLTLTTAMQIAAAYGGGEL